MAKAHSFHDAYDVPQDRALTICVSQSIQKPGETDRLSGTELNRNKR